MHGREGWLEQQSRSPFLLSGHVRGNCSFALHSLTMEADPCIYILSHSCSAEAVRSRVPLSVVVTFVSRSSLTRHGHCSSFRLFGSGNDKGMHGSELKGMIPDKREVMLAGRGNRLEVTHGALSAFYFI